MDLLRYRVRNFRSIEDSDWIDVDKITCLIGTNESGKTNLLLPLWKLNPAKEGEINPLLDYPRKKYNEIRDMHPKPVFVEAEFKLDTEIIGELVQKTGYPEEQINITRVSRSYDGEYCVTFPNASEPYIIQPELLSPILQSAYQEIEKMPPLKSEEDMKETVLHEINKACMLLAENGQTPVNPTSFHELILALEEISASNFPKRSTIYPRLGGVLDDLKEIYKKIDKPHPDDIPEITDVIINSLPKFVYYSNYGNLDSEIYLPHVIQNLKRSDLGPKEEAKTRTLRVLFEFVKLQPEEILELGKDIPSQPGMPNELQIKDVAEKKKERTILLQSASTSLTLRFRDWWRQGNYQFQFQADGDHFRIWVSDNVRPEPIELESRSSGLQWFLSFYLIFLVESQDNHAGSILLLDEPGLSLHPLAQEDLSLFFENLAETNQLMYTTHSPFMVDSDHLDRVRAVYVEDNGETKISSDLRAREKQNSQTSSIFPVHAALGLTVSEMLFQGGQVVIVEGFSDQIYLNTIKNYLIGKGLLQPKNELFFVPAGGVRGINAVASIITGVDEQLPLVILDGDKIGKNKAKELRSHLYKVSAERVILVDDLLPFSDAEIEDLFPFDFMINMVTRKFRGPEEDFSDVAVPAKPIVEQIEEYAEKHGIELIKGWKVELAKIVKTRLLANPEQVDSTSESVDAWKQLFTTIVSED